ncbi:sigma-54-dependent transcriptional regulator, partial [Albidovulum sp.]
MDGTVLIADDDRTIRTVLTQAFTRAGCKVHATASIATLMRWVEEGRGDLVVSDVVMPDGNGLKALPEIGRLRPDLPVIVISAQNTIMTAIQAAEAEAFDYLAKPFDLPDLMRQAAKALARRRRGAPGAGPDGAADAPAGGVGAAVAPDLPLVGRTPAMQALYRLVARIMNSDLPVLITGESGAGKSLVARTIHDFSDRRSQPFVVAQAAELDGLDGPSELIARGRGGTILLEEVAEFSPQMQGRIVRMLDALPADPPRIIATSQRDLGAEMARGGLREDLYYRLTGVVLAVPPLRERVEDIPLLAAHFLARAARDGLGSKRLNAEAASALSRFPWPGNVRQLENAIRRLVVVSPETEIGRAEVEAVLQAEPRGARRAAPGAGEERLSDAIARHLRRYFDLHQDGLPPPGLYDRILRELELPLIEIGLDATGGNQA